jgi:S-adenosyl methyltransferase
VRAHRPDVAEQALDNKRFQVRAITYVTSQGVCQFLDIGSGLGVTAAFTQALARLPACCPQASLRRRITSPFASSSPVGSNPSRW